MRNLTPLLYFFLNKERILSCRKGGEQNPFCYEVVSYILLFYIIKGLFEVSNKIIDMFRTDAEADSAWENALAGLLLWGFL